MGREMICSNLETGANGHLFFDGADTAELARKFGTPLYLIDEDRVRANCRTFTDNIKKYFPEGSMPLYASKAASFKEIYRIVESEGFGFDVVSAGEILTAFMAGADLSNAFFHSNNKTDEDIAFAIDHGVGCFVADGQDEVDAIARVAADKGAWQKILLRITPGIDPHTYAAVSTGCVDSKFGTAIETGQAMELVAHTLEKENLILQGFHCHVGSQVFGEDVFERAAEVMIGFIAEVREKLGYTAEVLDLGGGFGVRYVESDPEADTAAKLRGMGEAIRRESGRHGLKLKVLVEPGRAIVADAGLTLYTCGAVKHIPGYKTYVSVDGGMPDNPRFALYRSQYTVLPADDMENPRHMVCTLAGRCCESGDVIAEKILLPESTKRGSLIAVCTTGAYNYSMASNYNRIPRPPVVVLKGGEPRIAVRRETPGDLIRLDV